MESILDLKFRIFLPTSSTGYCMRTRVQRFQYLGCPRPLMVAEFNSRMHSIKPNSIWTSENERIWRWLKIRQNVFKKCEKSYQRKINGNMEFFLLYYWMQQFSAFKFCGSTFSHFFSGFEISIEFCVLWYWNSNAKTFFPFWIQFRSERPCFVKNAKIFVP